MKRVARPAEAGAVEEVRWTVRFYRDLATQERPARKWLDDLARDAPGKRLAAIAAIERVLKLHGTDVCETEWGKNLGKGLYEFRIRHPASSIEGMFPREGDRSSGRPTGGEAGKILLRLLFTTYGKEVILLCSGYDKGRDPSAKRQRSEIARARAMVAKAQAGLRARRREPG